MDPLPRTVVLTGDILTLDDAHPRATALRVVDGRVDAVGARADLDDGTLPVVAARGTVVPGFIDSHFYLQRAGIKIVDLFPAADPTLEEYQAAMARTALDPDWSGAEVPDASVRREGLRRVQPLLHALGITGVADPWATAETMSAYQHAHAAGELTMRVTAMPYFEGLRDRVTTPAEVLAALEGLGVSTGYGDERLAFGAVKVYVDGEGKRQQALRETPWPATGDHGIQAVDADELELLAERCARSGWALGVHAIGGAAMRLAIEAFERADARIPLAGRRFRLIHAYLEPTADTMARAAALGVLVSSQPAIQWQNGAWLDDTVGAAEANPLRSWLDAGVRVALGSDGPYFPFDPLRIMWFVRTRAVRGSVEPLGPDQRMTPAEALAGVTREAAFAAFADDRGRLVAGAHADWAELSVDPLSCPDDALLDARVLRTVSGGVVVFDEVRARG